MARPNSYGKQPDLAQSGRTDACSSNQQVSVCPHRNCREHPEPNCWQKYPNLKTGFKSFVTEASASYDGAKTSLDEDSVVCFVAGEREVC